MDKTPLEAAASPHRPASAAETRLDADAMAAVKDGKIFSRREWAMNPWRFGSRA